jgi:hypothetical protein
MGWYILRKWRDNKDDFSSFQTHIVSIDKLFHFLKELAGDYTEWLPAIYPYNSKCHSKIGFIS